MSFPNLFRKELDNEYLVSNFDKIQNYFKDSPLDKLSFVFYRISFPAAVTNFKFPHGLSFVPTDIIITKNSNNVALTLNWSLFDATFLNLTVGGATDLRLLVGRYEDS